MLKGLLRSSHALLTIMAIRISVVQTDEDKNIIIIIINIIIIITNNKFTVESVEWVYSISDGDEKIERERAISGSDFVFEKTIRAKLPKMPHLSLTAEVLAPLPPIYEIWAVSGSRNNQI